MMDPFSFNKLGQIRQQEILEQAARDRDANAMSFRELFSLLLRPLRFVWDRVQTLRFGQAACDEPVVNPTITTETC